MLLQSRNTRILLILLTLLFCITTFYSEWQHAREGEERIAEHGRIIADDLWNFNRAGASEYLQLAAVADHYERLTVVRWRAITFR